MRKKKYTRKRRRRRGGGKKGKDKTRKLVKAAKKRALQKKTSSQEASQEANSDSDLMWGYYNSNNNNSSNNSNNSNENGPRKYNPLYDPGRPKTKKATGTYAQLPKKPGTYAQLPKKPGTYAQFPTPLYREGRFIRGVQTNADAGAMAAILNRRRARSPPAAAPAPEFDVDEYYESEEDAGFADILPIGSEIVGHGKRADGTRFYEVRMGPKNIPKGFQNAGKPHTTQYAASPGSYVKKFDAEYPHGNGPFLEDEAGGLPKIEKLVTDYIAKFPAAGEDGLYGALSNSNGGRRVRRRKKRRRTRRRRRRSRRSRRRRRKRRKV